MQKSISLIVIKYHTSYLLLARIINCILPPKQKKNCQKILLYITHTNTHTQIKHNLKSISFGRPKCVQSKTWVIYLELKTSTWKKPPIFFLLFV